MGRLQQELMTVEAELRVPVATVQVVRFEFAEPVAGALRGDTYRLDMCLTPRPRNAQARYSDRWAAHRYYAAIKDAPTIGGLASWRLRLIDERLRELREPPTLAELAQLCKLSVRQLTRGFRVSRGSSIGDRVAQSRLDHARRLLTDDHSVKAVAYTLGFSSPSSFSYAFRQIAGETPREFRQRTLSGGWAAYERRSI